MLRFFRSQKGSALIETVLSLAIALPATFTVFEVCMYAYSSTVLAYAARDGVRYAQARGADAGEAYCSGPGCADPSGQNVIAVVQQDAANGLHSLSQMQVDVTWPDGTPNAGNRVKVTVTNPYTPYFNLPGLNLTTSATAEGRIEY